MDLFPTPFTLGTSSLKLTEILPAVVHVDAQSSDKLSVGCQLGSVYYSNQNQSTLKDTNFATIVYNKQTQEIHVVHKPPQFLGPCFNDAGPTPATERTTSDRAALTTAFGSARRQRILKEREREGDHRTAVTDTTVITKAMHGQKRLQQESSSGDNPDAAPADERARLLPHFNLTATSPPDIYPLDKLIPPRVLEALAEESQSLSSAPVSSYQTWSEQGTYQKCVIDRLLQLSSLSTVNSKRENAGANRLQIAQSLAYLSHMLSLFRLSHYDIQRKQPLTDTPVPVSKHLLNEFTAMVNRGDSGRFKVRTMSPMLRARLIYHMIAVILHCDNFKTTIDDLAVDFQMSSDTLRRYFVYMGCRISKEDVKTGKETVTRTKAVLTAPVKFPEAPTSKLRKRALLG